MRTVALALALLLVVSTGCTWSGTEPGLFREREPSSAPPAPPPTNPNLPVAAETVWTSAEGLRVTSRIAIHAVRRTTGMTVLDWSITPLSAPDRQTGDDVPPGFDVGLNRNLAGGVNIVLVDAQRKRVYRPLSHVSRAAYYRCLCTPVWAAQSTLHLGETRLLQVAYPELPASLDHVDVFASTLPVFTRIPVSDEGWMPGPTGPTDLSRPPEPSQPLTAPQVFRTTAGSPERTATLRVDEIVAGSGLTTVRWTLRSVTEQPAFSLIPVGPPLAAVVPEDLGVLTPSAPSGPLVAPPGRPPLPARWMTGSQDGRDYLECACSNFDVWALGLRYSGASAQLVTVYPALPRGVNRVDVILPGVGLLPRLPVTAAPDGATRVGPANRGGDEQTWTYDDNDPPSGWSTGSWPTPLPAPGQLHDYRASVEKLTGLPR